MELLLERVEGDLVPVDTTFAAHRHLDSRLGQRLRPLGERHRAGLGALVLQVSGMIGVVRKDK